jgi:hypothetical protein
MPHASAPLYESDYPTALARRPFVVYNRAFGRMDGTRWWRDFPGEQQGSRAPSGCAAMGFRRSRSGTRRSHSARERSDAGVSRAMIQPLFVLTGQRASNQREASAPTCLGRMELRLALGITLEVTLRVNPHRLSNRAEARAAAVGLRRPVTAIMSLRPTALTSSVPEEDEGCVSPPPDAHRMGGAVHSP